MVLPFCNHRHSYRRCRRRRHHRRRRRRRRHRYFGLLQFNLYFRWGKRKWIFFT